MKYALAIPYVVVFLLACIVSVPWIFFGIGVAIQDMEAGDRIIESCPASRFLDRATR